MVKWGGPKRNITMRNGWMWWRNGGASRPGEPPRFRAVISRRGAESQRAQKWAVLDFAFVFSRVERVERIDHAAAL